MGEILGIGMPHGPHPGLTDETMANNFFRVNLRSEKTPEHWKDKANWPQEMRDEWGDDEGVTAARRHREEVVKGFRAARQAVDEFNPDFVLVFGDDQYENFHEDVIPPFCVFGCEEMQLNRPPSQDRYRSGRVGVNVGTRIERPPLQDTARGSQKIGTWLANELTRSGFDVACSWKMHHAASLGHAFARTVDYLDWDRNGWPYTFVPFHVNSYGRDLSVPLPDGSTEIGRITEREVHPPDCAPPWRCYDLGRAVAECIERSPYRAVVIGSSSWSHASLTPMHGHLWGDTQSDSEHYQDLKAGRLKGWRDFDPEQIRASGQHEVLNWVCLAGAMEGRIPEIAAWAPSYIFNSSKCIAIFRPEAARA